MASKKDKEQGAPSGAPVGLPFNPFLGLENDPAAWLGNLPDRLELFLRMRPKLPAPLVAMAKDASEWAKYCTAEIEAGDTRSACQAAARAALATHLVWTLVEQEGLIAKANRDTKRQAGPHKPKRPEIDSWIDRQLQIDASAKSPELWSGAPGWITDQIGERRFAARVTQARKRRAKN